MVTNTEGYIHIIEYLTENLSLFENTTTSDENAETVMAVIERELGEQIISVCSQNEALTVNQRNTIVSEVDTIFSDLEEIFSGIANNPATEEQAMFINEFSTIIKNLFDTEINLLLAQNAQ